jgi:hypothetical protein
MNMNKVLATLTLVSAVSLSTQAQGLINFTPGAQKISINSVINGPATGTVPANASTTATTYYYALFASASATTVGGTQTAAITGYTGTAAALQSTYAFADNSWELVDTGVNTTAGKFLGNEQSSAGVTTVPGIPGGNTAQFVVVGWDAALGSSISALEQSLLTGGTTGVLGQTIVSGAIGLGNGSTISTSALFGGGAPFVQGFTLGQFTVVPSPEPTSIALGVMGGLSLLALRRKKK